jgi:hypothetical protein
MHVSSVERIVSRAETVYIVLTSGVIIHTILIMVMITDGIEERKISLTIIDLYI